MAQDQQQTPPRPDTAEAAPEGSPQTAEPNLEKLRSTVQKMLAGFLGTIQVDGDGAMTFAYESTRVFIEVDAFGDSSVVNVYAPVALEVPVGPLLYEWIAKRSDSWAFGHLGLAELPAGGTVSFRRTFPSEFLTEQQLRHTVGIVATTANEIDDEIVSTFGGKRARDLAAGTAGGDSDSNADPTEDDDEESPGYL